MDLRKTKIYNVRVVAFNPLVFNKTGNDLPKVEQMYWYSTRTTPLICNKGDKKAYGRVEHGLFPGLNISLSSVLNIGLSFIPATKQAFLQ